MSEMGKLFRQLMWNLTDDIDKIEEGMDRLIMVRFG
jgi:hypothetical protein